VKFTSLQLSGAYLIEIEPLQDERGFFARSFCQDEFAEVGLETDVIQCNVSFNKKKGTLRGMHYQDAPHQEAKLVRCTMGSIFDVIIDLRESSPSFKKWVGVELSADNRKMLYIPQGFAHGFQTLEDDTEVFYQMYDRYVPECARGVRWDDDTFCIEWPLAITSMSEKDESYEAYTK
jgi:dTDP-4-dehydrorhamnose 3,5-epimerase